MSSSRRASSRGKKAPEVLSAAYLQGTTNRNELLRRLGEIAESLSALPDDVDPTSHPGLLSLSSAIVSPSVIAHRDKDVRLRAVLAACELFYIFAPEPPWEAGEVLLIFGQLIRQLGNLHATAPGGNNFEGYFRMLEQLSEVKIGVVLVDLIRTERGGGEGGRGSTGGQGEESALDTLCELLRTLLNCVHVDHPPEVAAHAELAASACVEEFEGSVPVRVLEEILACVGRGPVVWVTNPEFAAIKKRKTPGSGGEGEERPLPPPQIQQTNPSYLVAAKVLRRTEDKISSPIASLLNGLLTGDPTTVGSTSLSTVDAEAAALLSPKGGSGRRRKKGGSGGKDDEESPTLAAHLAAVNSSKDADSGAANVYSVSYELHRIAPQILTTVIGTVSTSLVCQDLSRRWQAARLLGRLFGARGSDIAGRFGPCFREWLRRSYDPEQKVRETMVKCLANFLSAQHSQAELCAEVNEVLATVITRDPTADVRLLGIHQVCDLAHSAVASGAEGGGDASGRRRAPPVSVVGAELLRAVGNRVSSRNRTEHRDAITGLAQVYHRHYLRRRVRHMQEEGGDDVPIEEVLAVWREAGAGEGDVEEDKFAWVPQKVFECVSYPDSTDSDMRNRVFQIVDDVLLGTSKKDPGSGSSLTSTSRAVGLALIVSSVQQKDNAYKWMCALFAQRGRLQKALGAYLDARSIAKECKSGSKEAFTAETDAAEKLELVASLTAPIAENGGGGGAGRSPSVGDQKAILKKLHAAKDRHIFRILSTICDPGHSPSARIRALDELPKRTKSLGGAAQSWVRTLARRASMGAFLNAEVVGRCVILSRDCFEAGDSGAAAGLLDCVKMATSVFPGLGSSDGGFGRLVEFLNAARDTSSMSPSMRRDVEKHRVVTTLSEILARSGMGSSSRPASKRDAMDFDDADGEKSSYKSLREQLLRLCTRDGTPEQARNSVYTIASMIKPPPQSSPEPRGEALCVGKERKEFEPLLKALVNPSRLSIPEENASRKAHGRIVSVLSAVAAIAECAPHAFNAPGEGRKLGWGYRALEFCLDTVLHGRNARLSSQQADESSSDEGSDEEEMATSDRKSSRNGKNKDASTHCEMICGAIEVLVSHIRSTLVHSCRGKEKTSEAKLRPPTSDHIRKVFDALVQIIGDGGLPPSCADGRHCNTTKDKAELRRSASVNLLRLCDANLKLESTYLSPRMWHILSSVLLDEDKGVRLAFMEELSCMLTASGKFRSIGPAQMAPSLRFLSLVSLCADGDAGAHSAANAGAANVGPKTSNGARSAAMRCVRSLRATCQTAQAQCRSQGKAAERNFETRLKVKLMPEYCVPYALHLLAFRHETTSVAGTLDGEDDGAESDIDDDGDEKADVSGKVVHSQEASQKMLKKRLKWLFDPLIQSLGAGADNISFLLRMVELIGKHPLIDVLRPMDIDISSLGISLDDDEEDAAAEEKRVICVDEKEAEAGVKIICQFAREVLLSHVKKDVNLTVYPGSIQIPGDLYRARTSTSPPPRAYESESESSERVKRRRVKKSISHYVKKGEKKDETFLDDKSEENEKPGGKSMHDSEGQLTDERNSPTTSPDSESPPLALRKKDLVKEFGDVSPIAKAVDSPVIIDKISTSSRGRRTKRSSAQETKLTSLQKEKGTEKRKVKSQHPGSKTTQKAKSKVAQDASKNTPAKSKISGGMKKRKSDELEVFEDATSPETTNGTASPFVSDKATRKKHKSSRAGAGCKVKGTTPMSVPRNVMVNVTNSAPSSSSPQALASSQKKRSVKKKRKTSDVVEADDCGFNFSVSPVEKVQMKAKEKSAKPAGGECSRKKSPTSSSESKKTPARKARVSAKVKVTTGKASIAAGKAKKAKSSSGKGQVAASKAESSSGKKKSKAKAKKSPKATASTGNRTPRRGRKFQASAKASPSTTSEATSRASPVRRSPRRSARAAKD